MFFAVNIPAVLLWAPAHVLPGVLAVSALHRYGGFAPHGHIAKYYWILAVVIGAILIGLASRAIRRRREAAKPVIEPGQSKR